MRLNLTSLCTHRINDISIILSIRRSLPLFRSPLLVVAVSLVSGVVFARYGHSFVCLILIAWQFDSVVPINRSEIVQHRRCSARRSDLPSRTLVPAPSKLAAVMNVAHEFCSPAREAANVSSRTDNRRDRPAEDENVP